AEKERRGGGGGGGLAARSEAFTASAFQPISSGASSPKKCTPSATGSVLSTSCVPGSTAITAQSSARPKAPGAPMARGASRRMRASSLPNRRSWCSLIIACSFHAPATDTKAAVALAGPVYWPGVLARCTGQVYWPGVLARCTGQVYSIPMGLSRRKMCFLYEDFNCNG